MIDGMVSVKALENIMLQAPKKTYEEYRRFEKRHASLVKFVTFAFLIESLEEAANFDWRLTSWRSTPNHDGNTRGGAKNEYVTC